MTEENADHRAALEPWHPMTDPVSVKTLGKLIEELGELQSAAARCLIQGIDAGHPVTGKPNETWLMEEIADVMASIELTIERFFHMNRKDIMERKFAKKQRLQAWHAKA